MRIFRGFLLVLVALVVGAFIWLWLAPPDLIRVATNYSAKIVCSNVFIAGRDADSVLADDVQAPGHPILKYISVDTDPSEGTVTARFLGFAATATSVHRTGLGCTNTAGEAPIALALTAPADLPAPTPMPTEIDTAAQAIVDSEDLAGPNMRAIVVLRDGEVIAERYGEGFTDDTPLLGWSMTKTVTAALLGRLEQAGIVSRDDAGLFASWSEDARAGVTVADLLGMASDLTWNEGYGTVSDVTRMLYLEPDMGSFVEAAALDTEDGSAIGKTWNYSSGTTILLSRYWQGKVGPEAVNLPRQALFTPLGMTSAIIEPDAAGALVGGSYMYATARDWARFGQFLLQDGVWNGERLLPAGYVDWMMEEHPASEGQYARGHLWRAPPRRSEERGDAVDANLSDTVWLAGHDGQSVAIDRATGLVVVRLGLTPSKLGYRPENLLLALKRAGTN